MKFYFDIRDWALPIAVQWTHGFMSIKFLCFDWTYFFKVKEVELTEKEEFENLETFTKETLEFIEQERKELNEKYGYAYTSGDFSVDVRTIK